MTLFQLGNFQLASGAPAEFKLECDALTDDDLECLAWMGSRILPEPFREVVGVPTGGERFAAAMRTYSDPKADRDLIVDDVWTTGGSYRKFATNYASGFNYADRIFGLVIFARGGIPFYENVWAILHLNNLLK